MAGFQAELVDDLLGDFADGADVRIDEDVSLFIERLTRGQQGADSSRRVRVVEQGPVRLVLDAFPDFFRRRPEADDERVRFQGGQILRIHRQAAAGGDDRARLLGEFLDHRGFHPAEGRFAVRGENVSNRPARARLDEVVGVEVFEMQLLGDEAADRGFAGAHEADERDIGDVAFAVHRMELADFAAGRTLQMQGPLDTFTGAD